MQLQYEVDGKVFELRSTFSAKKPRNVEPSNNNFATSNKTITQPTKAIEFVIENKKYSTSSVNTKPFEEAVGVAEEERSALEASLELLQVGVNLIPLPPQILFVIFKFTKNTKCNSKLYT